VLATVATLDVLHDSWFYWTHRLLHWRPLYRHVHFIHHRRGAGRNMHACIVSHVGCITRGLFHIVTWCCSEGTAAEHPASTSPVRISYSSMLLRCVWVIVHISTYAGMGLTDKAWDP